MTEVKMPEFTIGQKGSIAGIRSGGVPIRFKARDIYTPKNAQELAVLMQRPDYVAQEIPRETGGLASGEIDIPPEALPEATTELEVAVAKQAFRDELIGTPQRELWERTFSDGSVYKSVWKHAMKKVDFVQNIMEKVYSGA